MLASASRRSLPVDVELELVISIVFWIFTVAHRNLMDLVVLACGNIFQERK